MRTSGMLTRPMRLAYFWTLAAALLVCAHLAAAASFDDGPGGATCRYYAAIGRLEWQHTGGDWVDAKGVAQGGSPFAATLVSNHAAAQTATFDLLPLAERWQQGDALPGALMLRAVGDPRASTGVVNFNSRENADSVTVPSLALRWSDGHTERLGAIADTFVSCPTHRSLGGESIFKVSASEVALLAFPFTTRQGQRLVNATLTLTSSKQYGRGLLVGAFAPQLPRPTTVARDSGLADALLRDAGLSVHADVLQVETFEDPSTWRAWLSDPATHDSLSTVDTDQDNGFAPISGKALRVTIRKGTSQALNHQIRFAGLPGGEPDEAYLRYHLRLGSQWDPTIDGGKLPGFAGTYGRAGWGQRRVDGHNGWSARGAFMRATDAGATQARRAIGSYVYAAMAESANGDVWGWNLGPTGLLEKNRWYAIEQYVKLNTPGHADGILRAWIDGDLAFSRANIRFRNTQALKVESVWLNVFHGGVSKADRDLTLYIDNLVIARRYIGPGRFPP